MDRLAFAPRVYKAGLPQSRQMLGQGRLTQGDGFIECAYRTLPIHPVAKHHQSMGWLMLFSRFEAFSAFFTSFVELICSIDCLLLIYKLFLN